MIIGYIFLSLDEYLMLVILSKVGKHMYLLGCFVCISYRVTKKHLIKAPQSVGWGLGRGGGGLGGLVGIADNSSVVCFHHIEYWTPKNVVYWYI